MPSTIALSLGRTTATVALDSKAAPSTCHALLRLLPITTTAHYAKIAGHEFYLHLPLFLEPEQYVHVEELARGTVAFWPERQLLCVYYGRIQDEDATVTRLGRVVENLSGVAEAAEVLRLNLGRSVTRVTLSPLDGRGRSAPPPSPTSPQSDLAQALLTAYTAIQETPPPEVEAVVASRGVMRPAGPLIAGEAEARKLHEIAWLIRGELLGSGAIPAFAAPLLRHFAQRLAGWYGLPGAGRLVSECAAQLPALGASAAVEAVEALILFIGRLSLWLDAYIPWEAMNGSFLSRVSSPRETGGHT